MPSYLSYNYQTGGGWYGTTKIFVIAKDPITKQKLAEFGEFIKDHLKEIESKGVEFPEVGFFGDEAWEELQMILSENNAIRILTPAEFPKQFPGYAEELGTPYLIEIPYKYAGREYAEFFFEAAKIFFKDAPFVAVSLDLSDNNYDTAGFYTEMLPGPESGSESGSEGEEEEEEVRFDPEAYHQASENRIATARENFAEWEAKMVRIKPRSPKKTAAALSASASVTALPRSPRSSRSVAYLPPPPPKTSAKPKALPILAPSRSSSSASATGGQCRCLTQKKTRCSRSAQSGSQFCYQHQACARTI